MPLGNIRSFVVSLINSLHFFQQMYYPVVSGVARRAEEAGTPPKLGDCPLDTVGKEKLTFNSIKGNSIQNTHHSV